MMLGTLGHHDGWTGEDPADDADGMPGMGAPAALAGLGGVGYLLARQRGSEPTSDR